MWIIGLAIVVGFALLAWVLDRHLGLIFRAIDGILLTLVKGYDRRTSESARTPER